MKMPDKIDENSIAPCGVNCLSCSAYLRDNKPCAGCRAPSEKITRKSCRQCIKKGCAFDQGLSWCFECAQFPCSKIKKLSQRYSQNYHVNLIQNGFDAKQDMTTFLIKQRKKYTCPLCGGVIDQHHKKCSLCKSTFDYKNDKDINNTL